MAKYERGDVVRIVLNPTAGQDLQGESRPALVLSPAAMNALGMAIIAPITQSGDYARYAGFAVHLTDAGMATKGVALVNMIRPVDLDARKAKKVERAPQFVVDEALARLQAIFK